MTTTDIPEPVRDLLAAIVETLTQPEPSSERVDMVRFETCVSERVHLIQLAVRDVLDGTATNGVKWEADCLRKKAADRPPRYRTADEYLATFAQHRQRG
ncbi:hypothetical protein V1460_20875 [Streptomyces sp. SCSIO 30461]|uniref:hypothetical protein n=1 Tax=Streptomyces sp. SCSIO 30461 TaxID=3118085 RepID=UPI0030D3A6F2